MMCNRYDDGILVFALMCVVPDVFLRSGGFRVRYKYVTNRTVHDSNNHNHNETMARPLRSHGLVGLILRATVG